MPASGLDVSWAYAVNEAVARHLVFGRNVIWTIGPFGSVYTRLYNPATDGLMLAGSLLAAAALCAGLAVLCWPKRAWLLCFLPLVVLLLAGRDAFLMSIPFLLLLAAFRVGSAAQTRHRRPRDAATVLCIAVLSAATGILPLVKGTMLALAVINACLAALVTAVGGRRFLAAGIALVAIASLVIGWCAAGQPLLALPDYVWSEEPIIAGYSGAMSYHGPFSQVLWCVVAMLAIVVTFHVFATRRRGLAGRLVLLGLTFQLFTVFKEGFVRQDDYHTIIAAESFLFLGLFLVALLPPRAALAIAVIACAAWGAVEQPVADFNAATILARAENTLTGTTRGLLVRIRSPHALRAAFDHENATIRREGPLPNVAGSVDLYGVDLARLFAAGLQWDPRPIIQSYSAYTPALEAENAAHLLGPRAPRNALYVTQVVDYRLPALDDAVSWPLLLSRYSIVALQGGFLQMVRAAQPRPVAFGRPATVQSRLNEWIDVPPGNGLLWAKIDMHPTVLGRLLLLAFKLPQVHIELRLADGRTIDHRYIPEIGQTGFLLSPYVGTTADFAMMAGRLDPGIEVRQFMLRAPALGLWTGSVGVSFMPLQIPPQRDVREKLLIQPTTPPPSLASGKVDQIEDCSLDVIDDRGFSTLTQPVSVGGAAVSVLGWTAPSTTHGIGPDETWISLTDAEGSQRFYRATVMPRPDVQDFFKQPKMKEPGFSAFLDLQGLSGIQKLAIYSLHGQQAYRCRMQALVSLRSVAR
ncbi:MAG TPA: hypothetical protein VGG99_01590 [Acetobacteraceae bacterium]